MSEQDQKKRAEAPQAMVTIVINNQERIESIGIPSTNGLLVLMPGLNLVDPSELTECLKNDRFRLKFETRIGKSVAEEAKLERVGEMMLVQGKTVPAAAPLSKLDDAEAIEMVNRINLEETIERVLAKESRSEVRAALMNRRHLLRTGEEIAA